MELRKFAKAKAKKQKKSGKFNMPKYMATSVGLGSGVSFGKGLVEKAIENPEKLKGAIPRMKAAVPWAKGKTVSGALAGLAFSLPAALALREMADSKKGK